MRQTRPLAGELPKVLLPPPHLRQEIHQVAMAEAEEAEQQSELDRQEEEEAEDPWRERQLQPHVPLEEELVQVEDLRKVLGVLAAAAAVPVLWLLPFLYQFAGFPLFLPSSSPRSRSAHWGLFGYAIARGSGRAQAWSADRLKMTVHMHTAQRNMLLPL